MAVGDRFRVRSNWKVNQQVVNNDQYYEIVSDYNGGEANNGEALSRAWVDLIVGFWRSVISPDCNFGSVNVLPFPGVNSYPFEKASEIANPGVRPGNALPSHRVLRINGFGQDGGGATKRTSISISGCSEDDCDGNEWSGSFLTGDVAGLISRLEGNLTSPTLWPGFEAKPIVFFSTFVNFDGQVNVSFNPNSSVLDNSPNPDWSTLGFGTEAVLYRVSGQTRYKSTTVVNISGNELTIVAQDFLIAGTNTVQVRQATSQDGADINNWDASPIVLNRRNRTTRFRGYGVTL